MIIISFTTGKNQAAAISDRNSDFFAISEKVLMHENRLGIPAASIFYVLSSKNINPDKVNTFVHVGKDRGLSGKCLQQIFSHSLLPYNHRPLTQIDPDYACAFYHRKYNSKKEGILFYFSLEGFSCLQFEPDSIRKLELQLEPDQEISKSLRELYHECQADPEFLLEDFPLGKTSVFELLSSCFRFDPDGRIYLEKNPLTEILSIPDVSTPDFRASLCKITENMFLHYLNYIRFVTGTDNILVSGDLTPVVCSRRLQKCLNFTPCFDQMHQISALAGGIEYYHWQLERPAGFQDEQDISAIAENIFENIRKNRMEFITQIIPNIHDPIFIALSEAFRHCQNPQITFKIEEIVINTEGIISWLTFLFFIFGKDSSGYPYIVNHKGVIYCKKDSGGWKMSGIEFTVFRNDPILTVELTNNCNFRCIMCDQSTRIKMASRSMGFLDSMYFDRIVKDLAEFPVSTVTPFWVGESTLHKDFSVFIRRLFSENHENRLFANMTLNTNASLLTSEKSDAVIESSCLKNQNVSSFLRVHFSIDAASKNTYQLIHRSDTYDQTVSNIEYFLKKRASMNFPYPKVTAAFIIMPENQHEAADFLKFWKVMFDRYSKEYTVTYDWPAYNMDAIYFRRLDSENQLQAEMLHKKVLTDLGLIKQQEASSSERIIMTDSILKEECAAERHFVRRPCPGLWLTPIINWNLEMTVCCFDVGMDLKLGSLREHTIKELWDSPKINYWRLCHIRGEFHKIPRCAQCANLNAPTMKNADFVRYLLEKKLQKEIQPFLERVGAGV